MLRGEIILLTEFVDEYPELESDGATRLIQVVLHARGVQYKTYTGYVEQVSTGEIVQPHFWLSVGKFLVDFRLRKYLGDSAPHGVFLAREADDFQYVGIETPFALETSQVLYDVIVGEGK